MKKIFSTVLMSVMVFGFIACGNSKVPATVPIEKASLGTEVVDSSDVDTTVVTRGGTDVEGFGRCAESGCYCKAFKGRGKTCQNCGHAYKRHY